MPFDAGTGTVAIEATVAIVEAAGVATGVGAVVTPAATEAGVPTTRAAEEVVLPVTVWKIT